MSGWVFWNRRGIRIGKTVRGPMGLRFSVSRWFKR